LAQQVEFELREALQLALLDPSYLRLPPKSCAERFYDSHPDLMERLKRSWIVKRLAQTIKNGAKQGWAKLDFETRGSAQLCLPGFENLPKRIFLRNGARKLLDKSTVADIQQHLKMLRQRFATSSKIKKIEAVLDLMQKYTTLHPKITWEKVKEIENGAV
jgi:hypothetical protein